jgi:hypothetical protein
VKPAYALVSHVHANVRPYAASRAQCTGWFAYNVQVIGEGNIDRSHVGPGTTSIFKKIIEKRSPNWVDAMRTNLEDIEMTRAEA